MKNILLAVLASLMFIHESKGQDSPSNPNPEYAFSSPSEASVEASFPRAVYSPDNDEMFLRFKALHDMIPRKGLDAETRMRDFQSNYDSILNGLTGLSGNEESVAEEYSDKILSRLSWILEAPESVKYGAPVALSVKLRNESNVDLGITKANWGYEKCFVLPSIRLKRLGDENSRVKLTKMGSYYFYPRYSFFSANNESRKKELPSGSEVSVLSDASDVINLADYYDLEEPGEYELEFRTRRFVNDDGTPAENSDRAFPAPKTIRFTILPPKEKESAKNALSFHFDTPDEASREVGSPSPSRVPDNAEIVARFNALSAVMSRPADQLPGGIAHLAAEYEKVLDLLIEKKGPYNDPNAEKFSGLKWRVDLPSKTPAGQPVVLKLGLTNISENEKYRICKYDAMRSHAILSSIRLVRITENEEEENVGMTQRGTNEFYSPIPIDRGWRRPSFMSFISSGDLMPDQSAWIASSGSWLNPDLDLTQLFDLSKPGEYRLTFYTRRFLDKDGNPSKDQQRKYPRPDIVRFRITDPAEDR